jgi:hypothetical protein
MSSRLEDALATAPCYGFIGMVWELDVLRDVLTKRKGTDAQRNTLLRIIKDNAPAIRPVIDRLMKQLGDTHQVPTGTRFSDQAIQRTTEPAT